MNVPSISAQAVVLRRTAEMHGSSMLMPLFFPPSLITRKTVTGIVMGMGYMNIVLWLSFFFGAFL